MKNRLFILFLLLFFTIVGGHSGRTDSKGGHYDTKTGEYHFHHHSNGNFILIGCGILLVLILSVYIFSKKIPSQTKTFYISDLQREYNKRERQKDLKDFSKGILKFFLFCLLFIFTMTGILFVRDGWIGMVIFLLFIFSIIYFSN